MNECKKLKIFQKEYQVCFPTVGQMIDIENMKLNLTNGRYAELALSPLKIQQAVLDVVDIVSYFSILIPDLENELESKNWEKLTKKEMKELRKVYNDEFLPWFKPLIDEIVNYNK